MLDSNLTLVPLQRRQHWTLKPKLFKQTTKQLWLPTLTRWNWRVKLKLLERTGLTLKLMLRRKLNLTSTWNVHIWLELPQSTYHRTPKLELSISRSETRISTITRQNLVHRSPKFKWNQGPKNDQDSLLTSTLDMLNNHMFGWLLNLSDQTLNWIKLFQNQFPNSNSHTILPELNIIQSLKPKRTSNHGAYVIHQEEQWRTR